MFRLKQAGTGKMKEGGTGDEWYLNEVKSYGHQTYNHHHHLPVSLSPVSSCSVLSGNGFCCNSSEDGSSSSPSTFTPFGAEYDHHPAALYNLNQPPPTPRYLNPLLFNDSSNDHIIQPRDLSDIFNDKMNIGNEKHKNGSSVDFSRSGSGSEFGFGDCFANGVNVDHSSCFGNGFDNGGVYGIGGYSSKSFNDDMRVKLLGLRKTSHSHSQPDDAVFSNPLYPNDRMNYLAEAINKYKRGGYSRSQVMSSNTGPPEGFYPSMSQQYDIDSSPVMNQRMGGFMETPTYNQSCLISPSLSSAKERLEGFDFEDSFIVQGKNLKYVLDKGPNRSKGRKKKEKRAKPVNGFDLGGMCENDLNSWSFCPLPVQATHSLLVEVQGFIYYMAKDQCGCRFLQRIFDEGSIQDVQMIFTEIMDHVVELMTDQFGNYFVQKLLDVCSEEQRMRIVALVTEEPGVLIGLCLNTHGTRAVQKLIETLKTRQQISVVIHALEPGFLDLIKDVNGNHVLQRCLQCLSKDHNQFIFNAAAKFCVDIATHQHGCCVLNRCIAHSTGEDREKLVTEISANGFLLAQDPFANYVVQYIIELKIPSAAAALLSQFEGNYVYLAMQKFSSHVVEKCLKYLEHSRTRIIHEFLSVPHFDQLLQDPFANYVIQSALEVTKGPLHAALVEAVQPHLILRTSPYCKKIFSRSLLKK